MGKGERQHRVSTAQAYRITVAAVGAFALIAASDPRLEAFAVLFQAAGLLAVAALVVAPGGIRLIDLRSECLWITL